MLPFSPDQPTAQLTQYPSNNPPVVPQINLLPEADPILVYVSASVANTASQYAQQSPARMFCFNMLSSQNWNNPNFAEVVGFVCDACVLAVRTGKASSPAQVIQECTADVLSLYTGMLVCSYPELSNLLSQESIDGAINNHRIFLDLIEDSKLLHSQIQGYQPPPPPGARFTRSMYNRTPQQMQPVQPAVQALAHPSSRSGYTPTNVAPARTLTPGARTMPSRTPHAAEAAPVAPSAPLRAPDTLTGEIESMDREAHGIPYFGRKIPLPTAPIRRKFEEAIEAFEENDQLDPEVVGVNVNPVVLPAMYFDELTSAAMEDWLPTAQPGVLTAQVRTGWVMTPFASSVSLPKLIRAVRNQGTFAGLATEILAYIDTITDKVELRGTLLAASNLDRFLTKILNNFLTYGLASTGRNLSSTSFLEDAPGMSRYLNEKFNGQFNGTYTEYQKRVLCKLFANTTGSEDSLEDLRASFDGENAEFLTQAYTLILVNTSAQELDYSVMDTLKYIRASETPLLHRLLKTVFSYETKRDIPANHVLVLADGTRYMVYPSYGQPDVYSIREI